VIVVVFAIEREFKPWRARHDFHRAGSGWPTIYESTLGPSHVRVAICGIGAPRMAGAASRIFADADAVAVAGLAGALRSEYAIGDVLAARSVRRAGDDVALPAAPSLVAIASQCGSRVVESFSTAERIVSRAAEKRRLTGDAVEMESYPIFREAARCGIPAVAIRAVGDAADEDLPFDFNEAIADDGALRKIVLLRQVLASPSRWPMLARFAAAQQRALTGLARFLDRFVVAIS
jgi:adenosylhomocysteine nucleosidase